MSAVRHGTADELLALRDGEGSAWMRSHAAECAECAQSVYALEQMRAQLKALPGFIPPRDRWAVVAEQARSERRRRRMHSLVGVAAAAALAALTFVAVRPAPVPDAAVARAELDRAMLRSQAMEAALRSLSPEAQALGGEAAGVAAELESKLSALDHRLETPGAWQEDPSGVVDLWRQRAGILSALVDVHTTRATFAGL